MRPIPVVTRWAVLSCLLMILAPLGAQERFTFDTFRRIVGVGSPQVSPDGKSVAFIVTKKNYAENRNESEIYLVDVASKAVRPLTMTRKHAGGHQWSPDGRTLAFLASDSSGDSQIWLMPMQGGDPRQLTASPTGVEHYAWRPDGRAIAFAASDEPPKREGEDKSLRTFRVGDQDLFLRKETQPQHVWLQEIDSVTAQRLTNGTWTLEFILPPGGSPSPLSWSPDGKQIAFVRAPVPETGRLDSVSVWVLDVATRQIRSLSGLQRFQWAASFSPDGKWISYLYPRDGRYENVLDVHLEPIGGGSSRNLTRSIDRCFFFAEWMPGGKSLVVAANDQAGVGIWVVPVGGNPQRIALGDLVVAGAYGYEVDVAPGGGIAFVASTQNRPSELYFMPTPASQPQRLTDLQAWSKELTWGRMERVTWDGPDGFAEDGVLIFPPDFSPSKTYPLVLVIHGGPTSASKVSFNPLGQLMAAENWLVFMPNYRGSDNLGNAYTAAIVGDWGAGPGRDVMAGIAELRKRPYVDPKRTAVTGWSYGGYMTAWLIGNYPDEWTVAMAGAPVTNFEDQYNFGDGNVTGRYLFGGSPWVGDYVKKFREQSPITYVRQIKTPTLIMSNMEDFRVPPTQALALYRGLKDNGVETQFIGFPGRTHSSSDPVNSRERMRLWIDWVKQHFDRTK